MFEEVNDNLSSVIEACRCMNSDKITERRKGGDQLQNLLKNESYVNWLDQNSDSSVGFTWNDVFKAACSYLKKEVEKFKLDEEKGIGVTQSARSTRENQLKVSVNHLLNVIVIGTERKPRLNVELVLHHCITTLKDPFLFEKFGRDHLTALNREILPKRKYWSKLKPNSWLSLFLLALKIFKGKVPPNVTYVSLATILNYVSHHGVLQCDMTLKLKKKIGFFIDSLNNRDTTHKEHNLFKIWLDTSVHLALAFGYEDRLLVCRLTESTLSFILDSCHDNFEEIDLIVQYSTLAVLVHHPCNVTSSEVGFLSGSSVEEWHHNLRRLHSLIDYIVKNINERNLTAETKTYTLSQDQVNLAVRVARQMFSATQNIGSPSSGPPSSKRKRLISGLQELIDRFKIVRNESIPWVQIATNFLLDHETFAQACEIKEIVQHVITVTTDSQEYELMDHMFKLFRVCCLVMDGRCQLEQTNNFMTPEDISKLWNSICKCLIAHQCHKESFMLVATLLHFRLFPVCTARSVLDMVLKRNVQCDQYSMMCVAAFLEQYQLPEYLSTTRHTPPTREDSFFQSLVSGDVKCNRPTRIMLIDWLLPLEHSAKELPTDVRLHYKLLVSIMMRQTSLVSFGLKSYLKQIKIPSEFEKRCNNLESFFNSIEILQPEPTSALVFKEDNPAPSTYLPQMVKKVSIRISDLVIQALAQIENDQNATINRTPFINNSIHLLALIRQLTSSEFFLGYSDFSIERQTVSILERTLDLIFCEWTQNNSTNARRCVQLMTEMFQTDIVSKGGANDFLRQAALKVSWKQLDQLVAPSNSIVEETMGSVRRGSVTYQKPTDSIQVRHITAVHESLLDDSGLGEEEAVQVIFYHLLTVLCSPTSQQEALKPIYSSIKWKMASKITEVALKSPESIFSFRIIYHVLRSFTASPVHTIDAQLVTKLVKLSSSLYEHFGHDYEAAVNILEVFPRLCMHVSVVDLDSLKSVCVALLQRFFNAVRENLVGPPVEKAFYQCLSNLWPADPMLHWLNWQYDGESINENWSPIALETLKGLVRPLNSTVIFTSNIVHNLFSDSVTGGDVTRNYHWQEKVMESLTAVVMEDLDQHDVRDRCIRTWAMLATLSSVVVSSPWMEKRALLAMFTFCHVQKVDYVHLKRSLQTSAARMSLNYMSLMESRLFFLFDQWLAIGKEMGDFPYILYCDSRKEFFEKYRGKLLSILFIRCGLQTFIQGCEIIGANASEEIITCLGQILAVIITPLTASKLGQSYGINGQCIQTALDKMKELEQAVGREAIQTLLKKNLGILIYQLTLFVWDSAEAVRLFGFNTYLPHIGPYAYGKSAIVTTVRYLSPDSLTGFTDSQMEPYQSLFSLAVNAPWDLHCLLVDAFMLLEKSCRFCDKQQTLVSISVLIELITASLERNSVPVQEYALNFIVFRLCHVIRKSELEPLLRLGCLVIFKTLLETSVKSWTPLVAKLLPIIVGNLTPLAKANGVLQNPALEILKFLILTHKEDLKEAIPQLSPFPNLPEFAPLCEVYRSLKQLKPSTTLQQEIEHFLRLVDLLEENIPVESLEHLTKLLAENKEEFQKLYKEIAVGSGSFNDCSHSLLHRLICRLILLARNKTAFVQIVAVALGELGPSDLTTLILQEDATDEDATPLGGMKAYAKGHTVLELALHIIPRLLRYITDENIKLAQEAGKTLRYCLNTYEGHQFHALAKKFAWPELNLLVPFRSSGKSSTKTTLMFDNAYFEANVNNPDLWFPSNQSYSTWLCKLTTTLLKCFKQTVGLLSFLEPVCLLEPEFSQILLPHTIQLILIHGCPFQEVRSVVSKYVNSLFGAYCSDAGSVVAQSALKTMLDVVNHLRHQDRPKYGQNDDSTSWKNNFWIDLDYLEVAQAAQLCNAHFSTVMYSELSLDPLNRSTHTMETTTENVTDLLFSDDPPEKRLVQDLLFTSLSNMGEPDGFTGFKSLMACPAWDTRRYEHEGKWFDALESYDAVASYSSNAGTKQSILTSLSRCGLYHVMTSLAQFSNEHDSTAVQDYQYECAWRLGLWDQDLKMEEGRKLGFQQLLYRSLLSWRNGDQTEFVSRLSESRVQIMEQLKESSLECCRIVYPSLTFLRLIRDVEEIGTVTSNALTLAKLKQKWSVEDEIPVSDFSFLEPRLSLRAVILKQLPTFSTSKEVSVTFVNTLLQTCREARLLSNYQVANRCLVQLMTMDLEPHLMFQYRLEKALTEWQRRNVDVALGILKSLALSIGREAPSNPIYPQVLSLYGQWLADTRSENPHKILTQCFRKSVDLAASAKSSDTRESVTDARLMLAKYADSLYNDVASYLESREFEAQQKLMKIRKEKAEEMSKLKATTMDQEIRKASHFLTHETAKDQNEYSALFQERETYLIEAVENYLICLTKTTNYSSSTFDVRISRLISLWFDNRQNVQMAQLLHKWLPQIPSCNFIPVLPQLAARLTLNPKPNVYHHDFPQLLLRLLERCAIEHPYHTLPIIMALVFTNKDKELTEAATSERQKRFEEERILASKELLLKLKKKDSVGFLCMKWEYLSLNLIKFANQTPDSKMKNPPIPAELVNLRQYEKVAIPTVTAQVHSTGNYSNVVGIIRFEANYELVGGINAPKKMIVVGTDGRKRPILLKGKDDLRQDAVMQQVFSVINSLFTVNEQTRKRHLRIRTYKVVPLSRRSGILEWCENTLPIQQYLLGKDNNSGAHLRYHPNDLKPSVCMQQFVNLTKAKTLEERVGKYQMMCTHFQPVFRHFFFERFTSPSVWYEKRLAYIRSVATSSMVGYILGLGDRHLMNILIDENTAEFIHIDLGIAFDQGTVLPVPETTPFRLTRDIVDAMGVMGVEGVFRRCCEFTMEVMRQQQHSILTLLEVLLYDPLYVWTITPQKAAALQNSRASSSLSMNVSFDEEDQSKTEVNESAKRTLIRLGQKLKGVEKGTPLSVSGQVNFLIQQAIDPSNLCRMYQGWRPYV